MQTGCTVIKSATRGDFYLSCLIFGETKKEKGEVKKNDQHPLQESVSTHSLAMSWEKLYQNFGFNRTLPPT